MPYNSFDNLPDNVKRHGKTKAKRWMDIWNSVYSKDGDESKAFAVANASLTHGAGEVGTTGELTLFAEAFPDTFEGEKVRVQVFKTGHWQHPTYGDIDVLPSDLERMVQNFNSTKRALVLDYDHGTDVGNTPEDRVAAGWLRELELVTRDGGEVDLFAVAEMTPKAAEYVKNGEYRLFSPTWVPDFTNKDTGESQGPTLLRGALTNNPFIDGMHPAVPLSEKAGALLAELQRKVEVKTDGETPPKPIGDPPPPKAEQAPVIATGAVGSGEVKRMDVDLGGIKILTEKVGMPAESTPQQLVEHMYFLFAENQRLRADNDKLTKIIVSKQGIERQLKEQEADKLVEDAIRLGKIEVSDREYVKAMYFKEAITTKKWLDSKPSKLYLLVEQGLGGDAEPIADPIAELQALAAEKRSHDPKLSKHESMQLVLRENEGLAMRYREAVTPGAGRGGV